jgi:hypothetical protein
MSVGLVGIDLVLEGEANKVDGANLMEAIVARFNESGWPVEITDGRLTAPYSAPSAGPPPWDIYRFICHTAFGVATADPGGAMRWRFG